jgi:hypothetical protein
MALSNTDKVRENQLRRKAARQGLTLTRSRRRDPDALGFGKYWLRTVDGRLTTSADGASLDEIERYLTSRRERNGLSEAGTSHGDGEAR